MPSVRRAAGLAKQLIAEATLLMILGASLGVGLGLAALDAIEWIGFTDLPRAHGIRFDGVVLAMTLVPALLLGIVVGAVPALQLARVSLSSVLNGKDVRARLAGPRSTCGARWSSHRSGWLSAGFPPWYVRSGDDVSHVG